MAVVNVAPSNGWSNLFDQIGNTLSQRAQQQGIFDAYAQSQGAQQLPDGQQPSMLSRLLGAVTKAPISSTSNFGAIPNAPAAPPVAQADAASQAPTLPSFAAQQGSATSPNLTSLFASNTSQYGLPQGYLPRLAAIESKFNPNAVSSTGAAGPYQFTKGTAAQYGLTDPTDWAASTNAAAQLTANNNQALTQALGRQPTPGELYLAHQQGAGGAIKLLSNPNARAGDVVGDQAVAVNGGNPNMTAGQFANMWISKFGGASALAAPVKVAGDSVTPPAWYRPTRQPDAKPGAASPAAASSADDEDASVAPQQQAAAAPQQATGLLPATAASRGGGVTPNLIQTLLSNPYTQQMGMQLWQQSLTGKNYGYMQTSDGSIIRTDPTGGPSALIYHAPTKGVVVNKNLVNPATGDVIYKGEQDDPKYDYKEINGHLIAANAADAGDVKDVTPSGIPAGYRAATPEERQAYGVTGNTPLVIGPDGKPSSISNGVTVNLGDKANGGLDTKIVDTLDEGRKNAVAAANTLQNIDHMGELLDSGQLITGAGANQLSAIRSALATTLGIDDPGVSKTQEFLSAANAKASSIARSISGAGHTTNADLDMAKIISGADPTYSAAALRQILQWQQQSAQQQIDHHNADVDAFSKIQPDAAQRAGFFKVQAPQSYDFAKQPAAAGHIPTPAVGSVEGGYRYKGGDPAQASSWMKVP